MAQQESISQPGNRLAETRSPYLLQHAGNPVHWWPWCEAAFAEARQRDCPVFLSIGYSTCHWCHVMEHESFENGEIAQVLNDHFVSIKVDREERPDIDRTYMAYVMATTGSGGWPMSVWLTPEGKPFYGGTYFPPDDRYGRPGFPQLLQELARLWQEDRQRLLNHAEQTIKALRESQQTTAGSDSTELQTAPAVKRLVRQLAERYDHEFGGFGTAPKFPSPPTMKFLLRSTVHSDANEKSEVTTMVLTTLRKMAAGGIYDHLGGGFHRYSVDRIWHVPHFEKMLYDQAQLIQLYLSACQVSGAEEFAEIAGATIDYTLRDLRHPDGGFFSAEDADSLPEPSATKKIEGAFYVWRQGEIEQLLGAGADLFCAAYGVRPDGNVAPESDPHGELQGRNVLIRQADDSSLAKRFEISAAEVTNKLADYCSRLLEHRGQRPRPHLDDKVLTAWNGMMIAALSRAARVLERPELIDEAERCAEFIRDNLSDAKNGNPSQLYRAWRDGHGGLAAFPDDYAQLINGLLQLYMAVGSSQWLNWAIELQQSMDNKFRRDDGSYAGSDGSDRSLPVVLTDDHDGVEPTATSQAVNNLATLAALSGNDDYRKQAQATASAFAERLQSTPSALPALLGGMLALDAPPGQVVFSGSEGSTQLRELQHELARHYLPFVAVIHAKQDTENFFAKSAEVIKQAANDPDGPAARVCTNFTCKLPARDAKTLRQAIAGIVR